MSWLFFYLLILLSTIGKEKHLADVATSIHFTMGVPNPKGERDECFRPPASDEEAPADSFEDIVWEDESDFTAADQVTADMVMTTMAAGILTSNDNTDLAQHTITWGRHTGLYDGT